MTGDAPSLVVLPGRVHGVLRVSAVPRLDDRGFFARSLDPDVLVEHVVDLGRFLWSSTSRSRRGTVRGLHVRCLLYTSDAADE